MLDRIFKILDAQWLIHRETVLSYVPLLLAFTKGQNFESLITTKDNKIQVVGFSNDFTAGDDINAVQRIWQLEDDNIPDNSIAIIPVDGPICSWDSQYITLKLNLIDNNPRIIAKVLVIDSPGGMVMGTDVLTNLIKNSPKPSVAIVTGMCASAAMWLASGASYRIAASKMNLIGSVGTMLSIQDFSSLFEKLGIKTHEIYATKSTRKNEEERELMKGNEKPLQDIADFTNEVFHEAIRANLGISAESEIFTGAIFFAEKAKELGLINEINTLDYAIDYAYQLGLKYKINQLSPKLFN